MAAEAQLCGRQGRAADERQESRGRDGKRGDELTATQLLSLVRGGRDGYSDRADGDWPAGKNRSWNEETENSDRTTGLATRRAITTSWRGAGGREGTGLWVEGIVFERAPVVGGLNL